jgi:hypothetical protein
MLRRQRAQQKHKRYFTAAELAEFVYCPLVWWYEQYEPAAQEDTETLFARMVELEQEHGPRAASLPEYQLLERLLLQRGAFDSGRERHSEHSRRVEEIRQEARRQPLAGCGRALTLVAVALLVLAVLFIAAAFLLH